MRFLAILRTLVSHQVEFVIVGGYSAMVHGSDYFTRDLDIVHHRSSENIPRLLAALTELNAEYRYKRGVAPNASHVSGPGHQLLNTKYGWLDALGAVGKDDDYVALLPQCELVEVEPGVKVQVINLETLIRLKEKAGREKDAVTLPELRALLAEKRRQKPA